MQLGEEMPPTQPSAPHLALEKGLPCGGRAAEVGAEGLCSSGCPGGTRPALGTLIRGGQACFVAGEAGLGFVPVRKGAGHLGTFHPLCPTPGSDLQTSVGS